MRPSSQLMQIWGLTANLSGGNARVGGGVMGGGLVGGGWWVGGAWKLTSS